MKKFAFFCLCALICVSLFAGGGGGDRADSSQRRSSAAAGDPFGMYTPTADISTSRTIDSTVRFDQTSPDRLSLEQNRWNRAYMDQLGVNLSYKWIAPDPDSHTARWNVAMASGDLPDFAFVTENVYRLLYDSGYMEDMTDIFPQYASPELLRWISPDDITRMTIDGRLMGFPLPAKAHHGGTLLWLRKDWLDRLGLPVPTTFEEVITTARAFQDARLGGNDTIGILLSNVVRQGGGVGPLDAIFNSHGAFLDYWLERDGGLIFSETLPEMRDALLALQALYREGIINRDFAAINSPVALEYLSTGRAGIAYATSWSVSPAIVALWGTQPEADIINILPPPVRGRTPLYQINAPQPRRMFVHNKSRYPEAGIKLANITLKNLVEDYGYYSIDPNDSFYYYKFIPWGDMLTPMTQDIATGDAIRNAVLAGQNVLPQEFLNSHVGSHIQFDSYLRAMAGEHFPNPWLKIFGPGGYYTNQWDAYVGGKHLVTAFKGLPTDTMVVRGNILLDELRMTIFDVIMGADISVFDRAVDRWRVNGGNQITREVNEWYRNSRR